MAASGMSQKCNQTHRPPVRPIRPPRARRRYHPRTTGTFLTAFCVMSVPRRRTTVPLMPQPARDRLAVWTYTAAGEEVPHGDPSVTDAERAAAGRETLEQRWRELLEPNRRRAARQHAAGGLPDGEDVVRVWSPRYPAALRARLGGDPLAVWAEDDILHVLCPCAGWQVAEAERRSGLLAGELARAKAARQTPLLTCDGPRIFAPTVSAFSGRQF